MSLLDALLLDPVRQDKEIWLASRTDDGAGSGTQQDPYHGGIRPDVPIWGSVSFSDREFIISTSVDHKYADGETVHLDGSIAPFNGDHVITKLSEREFKITLPSPDPDPPPRTLVSVISRRKDTEDDSKLLADSELFWPVLKFTATGADHGYANREIVQISGAANLSGTFPIFQDTARSFYYSPATVPLVLGNASCAKIRFLFDEAARVAPEGATIHIGPGVFQTRGSGPGLSTPPGWRPRSGQKIIGSGMGATTLKLVGAPIASVHYYAIGTDFEYLDAFEVSDLTVDCNVEGQTSRFIATGAVGLIGGGRHIRIRRVRAINFGTRTAAGYVENFPLFAVAALGTDSYDLVFEDCIAEWPAHNNYWNSTVIVVGGGENPRGDGVAYYARGCAIRNCYVNCEYYYGPKVRIVSVDSYDSGTGLFTVTTATPHGKTSPGNVLVQGLTLGGAFDSLFQGVFEIESTGSSPTQLTLCGPKSQSTPDVGAGTLGGSHPAPTISIESITQDAADPKLFTITTREPHYRTRNNNVWILLVDVQLTPNPFNGVFAVEDYDPSYPCQLKYRVPQVPGSAPIVSAAWMNVFCQGLTAEPGTAAVVEGNRIFHAFTGGPYQDTFTSRDLVTRNNYYHDVNTGPSEARGLISQWYGTTLLDSLVRLWDSDPSDPANKKIAVATTRRPHGLIPGPGKDRVAIEGAIQSLYNGTFQVMAVPGANVFHYDVGSDLLGPTLAAGYRILDRIFTQDGRRPLDSMSVVQVAVNGVTKWRVKATMAPVPDDPLVGDGSKSRKHGLEKGDGVQILNAGFWNDIENSKFNGFFTVGGIPTDSPYPGSQFEYDLDANPGATTGDFSPGYFGRVWGPKRLVIENNVIELGLRSLPGNDRFYLRGISLLAGRLPLLPLGQGLPPGTPSNPPYLGPVVIRSNVIRRVDNAFLSDAWSVGLLVDSCESALLQDNIIRLDGQPHPIKHFYTNGVRTSRNMTPAGELIRSYHGETGVLAPDLEATLEELELFAFVNL